MLEYIYVAVGMKHLFMLEKIRLVASAHYFSDSAHCLDCRLIA